VKHSGRQWLVDLRWGLVRGLFLGALAVAPATVALAMGLASPSDGGIAAFVKRLGAYLAFGAVGGLLAGAFRPHLRVKRAATAFGAFLGVLGFLLLLLSGPSERGFAPSDLIFLLLGAGTGAILGWFAWGSFRRHGLL
jgi:hypothetical protein